MSETPDLAGSDEVASDLIFARLSWSAASPEERAQMLALGPLDPSVYRPEGKALEDLDCKPADQAPLSRGHKNMAGRADKNKRKPHLTLIGSDATKADLENLAAHLRAQAAAEYDGE